MSSLRRIETITNNTTGKAAKVYRDSEWQEYRVKFYLNEEHQVEADYHTDDKADAQQTARFFAWGKAGTNGAVYCDNSAALEVFGGAK